MTQARIVLFVLSLLVLPLAAAQFGNFFQGGGFPFGQNPFGHGQQQQQGGGRTHKGWQEMDTGE